ncbi:universal stress protein [Novipirellula artificiosorum]|uniref:Universal stress protein n=1 Tax=Novipirellula artificiosorum TaxID=2528016 RepID=A0A5C6DIL4_9BACT|nr:universal stress protein [Novipirellula artificiosorum]TWU37213.1 Universal stress protein [Novipirellula artificiosorum]
MAGLHANRVVAPIDFSDFSIASIEKAVEIAGDEGAVYAVHVLAELNFAEPGMMYTGVSDQQRVEQVEEQLRNRLAGERFAKVNSVVLIGDPGHEVAGFAEKKEADLIVIASHGYGFFKHMLLGSVAERVVRLAHCPVLVLRS